MRRYTCSACDTRFDSKDSRERHYRSKYLSERYKCPKCDMEVALYRVSIHAHFQIHYGSNRKRHSCSLCTKSYATKYHLQRYSQAQHKGTTKCSVCGKKFSCKTALTRHYQIQHLAQRKRSECPDYDEVFSEGSNIQRHNKQQHLERDTRSKCPICGKLYSTQSNMEQHHRTKHLGQNLFRQPRSCKYLGCSKILINKSAATAYYLKMYTNQPLPSQQATLYQYSNCSKILSTPRSAILHFRNKHSLNIPKVLNSHGLQS